MSSYLTFLSLGWALTLKKDFMKIITSSTDDFLYERIIRLLEQVKLVRGGTELAYTLRNHPKIRNYCREKQKSELDYIDSYFFHDDGTLRDVHLQISKNNIKSN